MTLAKRMYWVLALVAILALAGAGVTMASRLTSAGGPDPTPAGQTCDAQDEADNAAEGANSAPGTDNVKDECDQQDGNDGEAADDAGTDTTVPCSDPTTAGADATEAKSGPDTDNVEEQCGAQGQSEDGTNEAKAAPGQIDDGKDLLPQASITVDQAIAAAQGSASGDVGEIDLEDHQGKLAFNVEIGGQDVKVDASSGAVLGVGED